MTDPVLIRFPWFTLYGQPDRPGRLARLRCVAAMLVHELVELVAGSTAAHSMRAAARYAIGAYTVTVPASQRNKLYFTTVADGFPDLYGDLVGSRVVELRVYASGTVTGNESILNPGPLVEVRMSNPQTGQWELAGAAPSASPISVYVRVASSITALGGTVSAGTVTCAALDPIPTGKVLWLTNDGADSGFYAKSTTDTFTETTNYLADSSHIARLIAVGNDLGVTAFSLPQPTVYEITGDGTTATRVSLTPAQATVLLADYGMSADTGWQIAATDEPASVLRFTGISPGVNDGAFVTPNLGNITTELDFQVRCKPTGPPSSGIYAELLTQTHDSHVGAWDNFEAALVISDGTQSVGVDGQWLMFYEHTAEGGTVEVVPPDGPHVADASLHVGVWSTLRWNHDLTTGTISFYREVAYGGTVYDGRRWRLIDSWTYTDAETIDNGVTEEWHLGLRFVGDIEWARIHIDGALVAAPAATDGANGDQTITDSEGVEWTSATAMVVEAATGGTVDVVSNVAQDRILGRTASGSGDSEELTAANVRTFLGISSAGAALIDDADAAAQRTTLGVATPPRLIVTGQYNSTGLNSPANTTLTSNRLYYVPFFVPRSCAFDRIAVFHNATTAAISGRLGIYSNVGDLPSALITEYGTVDLSTTAGVMKTVTISVTLAAGIYWLAYVQQGAGACSMTCGPPALQVASSDNTVNGTKFENSVSGALPSTATPGAANTTSPPIIFMRGA
jgi:hypothetical protein